MEAHGCISENGKEIDGREFTVETAAPAEASMRMVAPAGVATILPKSRLVTGVRTMVAVTILAVALIVVVAAKAVPVAHTQILTPKAKRYSFNRFLIFFPFSKVQIFLCYSSL